MEQCYKNCSSPISGYAPASPCRRHIHSSFPHYFYSTPAAPPSSDSISAFVALCESRLVAEVDGDFAFVDNHRVPAAAVASQGKLLLPAVATKEPTATAARPLKPPPRLQYIANIRRSLRKSIPAGLRRSSRGGGGGRRAPKPSNSAVVRNKDGADPFAAAAHKVAREEDAPWCQLPWRRNGRKSKVQAHEAATAAAAATKSSEEAEAAAAASKNRRKGSWILRMLRSAIKGKEKEKVKVKESSSDSKEEEEEEEEDHAKNGQLVGLVRSTTVSRRRRVLVRRRTIGSSRRRH